MIEDAAGWRVLNELQPVAAGVGAGAVFLLAVLSKTSRDLRILGWLSATSAAVAGVLLLNWAVLETRDTDALEVLLFGRAIALSALLILVIPASAALARHRTPPVLFGIVVGIGILRVLLWPSTELLFRHEFVGGLPRYGPLIGPSGAVALTTVVVHLLILDRHPHQPLGRLVYDGGVVGAVVVASASLAVGDPVGAEVLTGYLAVPILVSIYVMALTRIRALRQLEIAHDQLRIALKEAAERDALTGLPNRRALTGLVDEALDAEGDSGRRVAVLLVDLDHFKAINDARGHDRGDDVLEEIARRLVAVCHEEPVCRFGGDKFAVVCTLTPRDDRSTHEIRHLADEILEAVSAPLDADPHPTRLTASIGIAIGERPAVALDLIRDADIALHRASGHGTNRVEVFDLGLRTQLIEEVRLRDALRGAVERDEIVVHYQPVVDLVTGRTVGAEALARWRHGGVLYPPGTWIPLAEQSSLIEVIGESVLRLAAAAAASWREINPEFSIAVNVSPVQLLSGSVIDVASEVIAAGLPPHQLILEVTESALVAGPAMQTLEALSELGLQIALDDFGVGYSSLGALDRLPIDILKIDRLFTHRLNRPDGEAVVRAIYALASSLELGVVAEGIENEEQHHRLISMGGRLGQGFHFSPPIDTTTFGRWLATSSVGEDASG